ncbi:MAG: three-Cys-motif partner protein TcmP [Myxococcales bacterium]|nr:three-Cys-motif partner protein TcmP [Myxococcales bacterium]
MEIPPEYHGREQSFLKHRVLKQYVESWAHKRGSVAKRLWYVDVFSGPWQSRTTDLRDTSICIGLDALESAAESWRDMEDRDIELGAIFVEKRPQAYRRLCTYLQNRDSPVHTHPFLGEFGERVSDVQQLIGDDDAFIFIDPTGFKGVEMRFISPLVAPRYRDTIINVMYNDINRWKDDERNFLRNQMREFFGLDSESLPPGLSERELMVIYRQQLKNRTSLRWSADLAIAHPTHDRTWFRLVVGCHHHAGLELFRDIERKVAGRDANIARTDAKMRKDLHGSLFSAAQVAVGDDRRFAAEREQALAQVFPRTQIRLAGGGCRWQELWPHLLEDLHLTRSEVGQEVFAAVRAGTLRATPKPGPRRRTLHDDDVIALVASPSAPP